MSTAEDRAKMEERAKALQNVHYRKWRQQASLYLGQWDLRGDDGRYFEPTVIIADVRKFEPRIIRKKKQADGTYVDEPNKRYEITFVGKRKKWLSGPVTQDTIAKMHGRNLGDWIGKPITLYVDPNVEFGGSRVGGIRVRPLAPTSEPTSDPLDRPVDEEAAERVYEARSEFEPEATR